MKSLPDGEGSARSAGMGGERWTSGGVMGRSREECVHSCLGTPHPAGFANHPPLKGNLSP